ncbi:MAG: hypothetical protein V4685_19460 [Bacteroidota bacterium]
MKKTIALLMLATSITVNLCAQSQQNKSFEINSDVIMNRRFTINLDKGNKLRLEMTDITDLAAASNIDSLMQVFFTDITPMKDSLSDPLTSKRIDYFIDEKGRKKIRFQQFASKGASFLVNKDELASLRTEQDTVHIIVAIVNAPEPEDIVSHKDRRYYHYTFFLNDVNELKEYFNNNTLNEKLNILRNNVNDKWKSVPGTGTYLLKKDNSITANKPKGYGSNQSRDYLTLLGSVNIQNYKNYFVPSFSVGARITLSNNARTFKREIGLYWEPNFLFGRDSSGKIKTYRNDFLTLTFSQGGITDHDPMKPFSFSADFSLGWLQRRSGEYFDKNTFRLGMGKIQMLKTSVEPCLYFNNFFKGVTPGIRITQFF